SFDVLVSTVIAVFDGEAIERFAIVQPELEEARLMLLVAAVHQLASGAKP
ncbi:MAG: hypothetical protein JWM74_705, partial [Myxococcaceae bacterium]|nr:hypothetical protein [Myxococcaceae bacterium]